MTKHDLYRTYADLCGEVSKLARDLSEVEAAAQAFLGGATDDYSAIDEMFWDALDSEWMWGATTADWDGSKSPFCDGRDVDYLAYKSALLKDDMERR